jgi:hypothetical protein
MWLIELKNFGYPQWFCLRIYDRYGYDLGICDVLTKALLDPDNKRAGIGWFSANTDSEAALVHDGMMLCRKMGSPLAR